MKHLQTFDSLQEADSYQGASLLGFIVYLDGEFLCGASQTFQEFASEVLGADAEEALEEEYFCYDHKDLFFKINNDLAIWDEDSDEIMGNCKFWFGLEPKTAKPFYEAISADNPYEVIKTLEKKFSNVKSVMTSNPSGSVPAWDDDRPAFSPKDAIYLARSIENRPEMLPGYFDKYDEINDRGFDLEDIIDLIRKDNKKLQNMIRFQQSKDLM